MAPRRHGFQHPWHPLQVTSWIVFSTLVLSFHFFLLPAFVRPVHVAALTAVYWSLALPMFFFAYRTTRSEAMDEYVVRARVERTKRWVEEQMKRVEEEADPVEAMEQGRRRGASGTSTPNGSSSAATQIVGPSPYDYPLPDESDAEKEARRCDPSINAVALAAFEATTPRGTPLPNMRTRRQLPPDAQAAARQIKNWCPFCVEHVDATSKHCRLCDKCVQDFDHHCKWLNTCIGAKNYRLFFCSMSFALLLLLYQGAICVFMLWSTVSGEYYDGYSSGDYIAASYAGVDVGSGSSSSSFPLPAFQVLLVVQLVLCVPLGLALFQLFLLHVYLLRRKMTTYEWIMERRAQLKEAEELKAARASAKEKERAEREKERAEKERQKEKGKEVEMQRHQEKKAKGSTSSTDTNTTSAGRPTSGGGGGHGISSRPHSGTVRVHVVAPKSTAPMHEDADAYTTPGGGEDGTDHSPSSPNLHAQIDPALGQVTLAGGRSFSAVSRGANPMHGRSDVDGIASTSASTGAGTTSIRTKGGNMFAMARLNLPTTQHDDNPHQHHHHNHQLQLSRPISRDSAFPSRQSSFGLTSAATPDPLHLSVRPTQTPTQTLTTTDVTLASRNHNNHDGLESRFIHDTDTQRDPDRTPSVDAADGHRALDWTGPASASNANHNNAVASPPPQHSSTNALFRPSSSSLTRAAQQQQQSQQLQPLSGRSHRLSKPQQLPPLSHKGTTATAAAATATVTVSTRLSLDTQSPPPLSPDDAADAAVGVGVGVSEIASPSGEQLLSPSVASLAPPSGKSNGNARSPTPTSSSPSPSPPPSLPGQVDQPSSPTANANANTASSSSTLPLAPNTCTPITPTAAQLTARGVKDGPSSNHPPTMPPPSLITHQPASDTSNQ